MIPLPYGGGGGGGACLRCAFTAGVCPPLGVLWLLLRPPNVRAQAGRMCMWVSWVPHGTAVAYSSVGDGACQARGVAVLFRATVFAVGVSPLSSEWLLELAV